MLKLRQAQYRQSPSFIDPFNSDIQVTMADAEKETRVGESDAHSLSSGSTTTPEQVHHNDAHDDLERAVTEKSHHTSQGNATKVVTALDWTGPDDPENPENWSLGKKAFHIAYVGLQCFVMYVYFDQLRSHNTDHLSELSDPPSTARQSLR